MPRVFLRIGYEFQLGLLGLDMQVGVIELLYT